MTHTPGPWHREGTAVYVPYEEEQRHGATIDLIATVERMPSHPNHEGDAALIAAAPAMLAALELFERMNFAGECQMCGGGYGEAEHVADCVALAIRAAIAQAKGE